MESDGAEVVDLNTNVDRNPNGGRGTKMPLGYCPGPHAASA